MTPIEVGLKPLTPEDCELVFSLTSNPKVSKFMRFSTHKDRSEAEELIKQYTAPGSHAFTIWLRMGGSPSRPGKEAFAGIYALKQSEDDKEACDLSLFLDPDCWGKGIASQLLGWTCQAAKEQYGFHRLTAWVVGSNRASRKALKRRGFTVIKEQFFDDLPEGLYTYQLELQ